MSYKAKLQPSYLLCPLRYTWHPIVKCIQKLDYEKYSIFSKETDNIHVDCDTFSIDNVNNFRINKSTVCVCVLIVVYYNGVISSVGQ